MAFLCVAAYAIGSVIRYNIKYLEPVLKGTVPKGIVISEKLSDFALILAYIISITYYLNLFGAFFLKVFDVNGDWEKKVVSSIVIAFIATFGYLKGLNFLEKMEKYSVSLKLSIILGLLVGLMIFNIGLLNEGNWILNEPHIPIGWSRLPILLGLIITVQGFETSRFLGASYQPDVRIKSMKIAQWVSTVIYLFYIALSLVNYAGPLDGSNSETAIIDQSRVIASALPILLIVAALAAQFSAAVADSNGGSGLVTEVTKNKIDGRLAIVLICTFGLGLTWLFDIFEIIVYASKAFAVYYSIQCLSSAQVALSRRSYGWLLYSLMMCLVCLSIVVFGIPAE